MAAELAAGAVLEVVPSDRVRKELAGKMPGEEASAEFGERIDTKEWNDRTYAACLERARKILFEGGRVLVDASFREASRRLRSLETADALGVRAAFLRCSAEPETVRERLVRRDGHGSDADWAVYRHALEAWKPASEKTERRQHTVSTECPVTESVALARSHLAAAGLS